MSYNWSFHSFDYDKFENALVHSRRKIVDAVIAEMRAFDNNPKATARHARIGEKLAGFGFSYEGWKESDFKSIDRFIFDLFHVCGAEISLQPESPEFLSPHVTSDLPTELTKRFIWSQPELLPAEQRTYRYLPFFALAGRRLGQQSPSPCEYVVLDPRETELLKAEIEKYLLTAEGEAHDAGCYNAIRKDFLGPVASTIRKRKALHAQLS